MDTVKQLSDKAGMSRFEGVIGNREIEGENFGKKRKFQRCPK
jgi:hypothetical protein